MLKITAGIGTIEDYILYAKAGADEMFAGYIPHSWMEQQGAIHSLNRREVFYYNVQLGSRSELEILAEMAKEYQKPVTITLNSLTYGKEQYPLILKVIEECEELGFTSFIVADPTLLLWIRKHPLFCEGKIRIHLSGECGEVNTPMIREMKALGVSRIIFHRKNTIADMKTMIQKERENGSRCSFEAFAMNEQCQFNGSFCNSLHCDELEPACRIPYLLQNGTDVAELKRDTEMNADPDLPGRTGCGLCALWRLQAAGVEYLKVVGRGNYTEDMIRDIQVLKKALLGMERCHSEEEYITSMKDEIFPHGCSGNCYYRKDAF